MKYLKKIKAKLNLFEEMLGLYSVSSYEEDFGKFLIDYYKKIGYQAYFDKAGNVLASKKKNPKIALVSHMDTVGFMIVKEEKPGYYKLNTIGAPQFENLDDAVCFSGGKEIPGILYKDKNDHNIGYFEALATSKGKKLEAGDLVAYSKYFKSFENTIVSPSLDDKSCVFIMLLIADELKKQNHDFLFCHTVREEFGMLGSKALPYSFTDSIKQALILDIVYADCPLFAADPVIGKGTGICFKDSSSGERKVIKKLINTAKKSKIPYQIEIVTGGGSDLSSICWQNGGIETGYVGVPAKNCHSNREILSISDIDASIELLITYEKKLRATK
ncbi:hypothetical protein KAJ27_12380 [bacterium]|nr:hypothetical protein [bacterium]